MGLARWIGLCVLGLAAATGMALAEEGMWTYDNLPLQQMKERYGFEPTQEWLDHLRLSSIRIGDGGSGSFISPNGLILTNHHVARGQLQKVSTPEKDYVEEGFLARTRADELPCPDVELIVLVSMENVTDRVRASVKPGASEKAAREARKAEMSRIERESLDATGLRSDVVTLYQGGEYWLYRYKRYTDVRLVFAPEHRIAFFGGDPDNFTYPRYDLDIALFRAYENGRPIQSPAYLKWNPKGVSDGELVFISGHPGSTNRMHTVSRLELTRDLEHPFKIADAQRRLKVAREYEAQGPEQARQADVLIYGLENGLKVRQGEYRGLLDPKLMAEKAREERDLRGKIAASPEWQRQFGDAWDRMAEAQRLRREMFVPYSYRRTPGYKMPENALNLYRYVAETAKPDAERLEEYREARLTSLRIKLFSPAPLYPGLEEVLLADHLRQSLEALGTDDPFVKAALEGRTPEEVAREVIGGTRLADVAVRKKLVEGGAPAFAASTDPLVALVRRIDPPLREIRKWHEDNVESVEIAAGEKIGLARFAVYGKSPYPDATGTLRLTYGRVTGYPMNGTIAPSRTTLFGLYDRAISFNFRPPFDLPRRYVDGLRLLDLSAELNFVSTCDIIGGNSGSPVVNQKGEAVGTVFDGNLESLVGRFLYDGTANRAVSVHTAAITELLLKLYGAEALVDELIPGLRQ